MISKETASVCLGLLAQVPLASITDEQAPVVLAARRELQAVLDTHPEDS